MGQQDLSLSEKFFNEIISHPVPLDMNILTALKRCSSGPRSILVAHLPYFLAHVLRYGSPGVSCTVSSRLEPGQGQRQTNGPKFFRRKVLRELKKIKTAWPDLNYSTAPGDVDPLVPVDSRDPIQHPSRCASLE